MVALSKGGGNSFLGGLGAGLALTGGDVVQGTLLTGFISRRQAP